MQDGAPLVHVIDDDTAVRESLEALLLVSGFVVETYRSAEDYLARAPGPHGCVLVDLHMPGMSGLELLENFGRLGRRTPVVVLTASRDDRMRGRAFELGARAFLTKPVVEATLIAAVRAAQPQP